jgi:hypothetical protein
MRTPPPIEPGPGEAGRFEAWIGAIIVCLLFLGLGLNIWPGWTRIAAWTHHTLPAPASRT